MCCKVPRYPTVCDGLTSRDSHIRKSIISALCAVGIAACSGPITVGQLDSKDAGAVAGPAGGATAGGGEAAGGGQANGGGEAATGGGDAAAGGGEAAGGGLAAGGGGAAIGGGGGIDMSGWASVGGTVTGLKGDGLVLQNNGGDDVALINSGAFVFETRLAASAQYKVTVASQPPGQRCNVFQGTGTIKGTTNVASIRVTCISLTLWTRSLDFTAPTKDCGQGDREKAEDGIAVDAMGNSYLAGHTGSIVEGQVSTGGCDAFLIKYDAQGTKIWVRRFGAAKDELVRGVTVDAQGNVLIVGDTYSDLSGQGAVTQGETDPFVAKYDSSGNKLWIRQIHSQGDPNRRTDDRRTDDRGTGVVTDKSSNVFITGHRTLCNRSVTEGYWACTTGTKTLVAKYDSSGTNLWTREFQLDANGASDELGRGISADANGNVYVAGETEVELTKFGYELFIAKLDTAGVMQWIRRLHSSQGHVEVRGVAADANGNTFVTGEAYGSLEGTTGFGSFLVKHDATGKRMWTVSLPSGADNVVGVTADSTGNTYVTGYVRGTFDDNAKVYNEDVWLVGYDTAGKKIVSRQFGAEVGEGMVESRAITSDGRGSLWVMGYHPYPDGVFVMKVDARRTVP